MEEEASFYIWKLAVDTVFVIWAHKDRWSHGTTVCNYTGDTQNSPKHPCNFFKGHWNLEESWRFFKQKKNIELRKRLKLLQNFLRTVSYISLYYILLGLLELSWFFASCICYSLSWLFLPQLCRRHSNLCMSGWHQWMSPHHLKLKLKPSSDSKEPRCDTGWPTALCCQPAPADSFSTSGWYVLSSAWRQLWFWSRLHRLLQLSPAWCACHPTSAVHPE